MQRHARLKSARNGPEHLQNAWAERPYSITSLASLKQRGQEARKYTATRHAQAFYLLTASAAWMYRRRRRRWLRVGR